MDMRGRKPSCPACTEGRFDYADLAQRAGSAVLCGRDAVQVPPARLASLDLDPLAARLGALGRVRANEHLLRFEGAGAELVVFKDGRAIVKGVKDAAEARSVYARYVGA